MEFALSATGRFAEERVANGFSRGLPTLDGLVDDHRCVGHRHPEADRFDGKSSPCGDANSKHLFVAIVPPAIRYGQCGLPHDADEKHEEDCEAEGAPVDDGTRRWEQGRRRNECG